MRLHANNTPFSSYPSTPPHTFFFFSSSRIRSFPALSRNHPLAGFFLLILTPFLLLLLLTTSLSKHNAHFRHPTMAHASSNKHARLSPTLEYINGTQVVWQIPSQAKAVVFIAHGCNCRATFFWDKHCRCPECIGLPEERALVLGALLNNYAAVAISSTGHCWSQAQDTAKVIAALRQWMRQRGLQELPVVAMGASSGGYFVSTLALRFKFVALVVMIAEGALKEEAVDETYPPILFVHMPKDALRAYLVQQSMDLLRRKGVLTAEVKCPEIPLTPHFFSERIPNVDSKLSAKMYTLLKENGFLDQNGFVKRNSRSINWQMPARKGGVLPNDSSGKLKWEHHIQEELNLAYGYHEMTSTQSHQIFEWFDEQVSKFHVSQ